MNKAKQVERTLKMYSDGNGWQWDGTGNQVIPREANGESIPPTQKQISHAKCTWSHYIEDGLSILRGRVLAELSGKIITMLEAV